MDVRTADESDRGRLAGLAATLQAHPDRHVAYLGTDPATIAAEMIAEDADWTAVSAIAEEGDGLVGWLMGSVDATMGRVWWFGPFVDAEPGRWSTVADALYDDARSLLPDGVGEEEFGPDGRFDLLVSWARGRGFVADTGSAVLVLDGPLPPATSPIRRAVDGDVAVVGPLHDELFAGTHTAGDRLMADADADRVRLVAERDGAVIGYVAVERQPDGDGYIDYLGVAEAARRGGVGAELVRAGVAALRDLGCRRVSLTVRADNGAARSLYTRLGFVEERAIIPLRRGFSLG